MRTLGQVVRLVIAGGLCTLLGGCVLSVLLGRVTTSGIGGQVTTSELIFEGGTGTVCGVSLAPLTAPALANAVVCSYTVDGQKVESTVNLIAESGLFGVLIDPVVLQVPAGATAFSGTFTGPAGMQALQITEAGGTLRADVNANIVAEPGMVLVVVDFPTNPATNTSYSFTLQFRLPGNVPAVPVKALFAAKVTVAGQTYYPPLLPCETDFARIPGVDLPQSSGLQAVKLPSPAGRGCAARVYQFTPGAAGNYQGLWWKAPAKSEDGWGLNIAHQVDTLFASWFTYDLQGKGLWLVMTAQKIAADTYRGQLLETRGPPFNAVPFLPGNVTNTVAGTATLTFSDANNGTIDYTINSIHGAPVAPIQQTKPITKQVFGTVPTCSYGTQPDLTRATNYQDLWWNRPAFSESGWGINLNHQGNTIFATWFTYDVDGTPMWLVATATKSAPNVYAGRLLRTSGPTLNATPWPAFGFIDVGSATFTFADGNTAAFDYTVLLPGMTTPATQSKTITRELFSPLGTTCQ
jgi:hypothetical protein